jgi:hypothetical protein
VIDGKKSGPEKKKKINLFLSFQLIMDKARQLTAHAKEQAMKFFQIHADKLTNDLKDKITRVLSTGEQETVELQVRRFRAESGKVGISLYIVHFFSSVAWSKNYWPIAKKFFFFLNLIFPAVRNFKFRHMFCRNKKFCSVKSRFPEHLP